MRNLGTRATVALGAAIATTVLLGAGVASAAVGDITEQRVPGVAPGGLNRVTTGPDGNIWFTDGGNNQIGRMTPAGVFTGFNLPIAGSGPIDITTGPDGALWFTEFEGRIGRITTSGAITEFALPAPPQPVPPPPAPVVRHPLGITRGPDGALWFVTDCCDAANPGRVGRVTTAGVITLFVPAPLTTVGPGITAGPDGNLWYSATASTSEGHVQRMSTAGVVNGDFRIPTAFSDPSRLVTGPDGNVWFTEQGAVGANGSKQPTFPAPGKIGRITPSGTIDEFTTPGQNYPSFVSNPAGIAVGADGNLWFTEYSYLTSDTAVQHGGNKIGRITTAGQITEFPIPTRFARADGITGGPAGDGGVYFTESPNNFGFGAIGRVQILPPPLAPVVPPVTPPAIVPVTVAKVNVAGFTASVSPHRDRLGPYRFTVSGRVRAPAAVGTAGCKGARVSVRAKVASRTVVAKQATLKADCTYRLTLIFRSRRSLGSGRIRVGVKFLGSSRLKPTATHTLLIRAG
jgi:streptogramin lyase